MNEMRLNHKPDYKQVERIYHIDNLKKKILLVPFLFAALIVVSLIILCNYFSFMDTQRYC